MQKNVTRGSNEYQAYRLARIKKNVKVYAVYGEHSFFYQDARDKRREQRQAHKRQDARNMLSIRLSVRLTFREQNFLKF